MNPAHILTPGIAIKFTRGRVNGYLAVCWIEVEPTGVGTPGVAGQLAVGSTVDPIVTGGIIGVGVRSPASIRTQPHPADVLGPGVAFQVVIIDRDPAAVAGVEV